MAETRDELANPILWEILRHCRQGGGPASAVYLGAVPVDHPDFDPLPHQLAEKGRGVIRDPIFHDRDGRPGRLESATTGANFYADAHRMILLSGSMLALAGVLWLSARR